MIPPVQQSQRSLQAKPVKKWGHLLLERFRIKTSPTIKVYHGFGTPEHMEISGHYLRISPRKQAHFSSRFWKNSLSLLRLFMVKPLPGDEVTVLWGKQQIKARTDESGYFHAEWKPNGAVVEGWHNITVTAGDEDGISARGDGKLLVPPPSKYAIASDIDDTFLISHSSDLARRLYVLLTSNARTRRPFHDVVAHYQLLLEGDQDGHLRTFFYVSSSEWNLYDYICEFASNYKLPDGIYLLNSIKQISEFWKTGKGKHSAKYDKIARLMATYPDKQFILLGDDSQEDPNIYRKLVVNFPGRVVCVYLRHVRRQNLAATRVQEAIIKEAGVEICYFTHSKTAIMHSFKMGLIK